MNAKDYKCMTNAEIMARVWLESNLNERDCFLDLIGSKPGKAFRLVKLDEDLPSEE